MRHEGLFEPEPEPKKPRVSAKKKARKIAKKSESQPTAPPHLGEQITAKLRSGSLMDRFMGASQDVKAPEFTAVDIKSGRAAKVEEKGLIVPRINYVEDDEHG